MRYRVLRELWARLTTLAAVVALIAVALSILGGIDGLLLFETGREIAREIGARVAIALGLAVLLGTGLTLVIAPYVLQRGQSAAERLVRISRLATTAALLAGSCVLTGTGIRWATTVGLLHITNRASIYTWDALAAVQLVLFVFWHRRTARRGELDSLSGSLSGRFTRRFVLLTAAGGLLTGLSAESAAAPTRPRGARQRRAGPNILLVTFDALSAQDMSCYGYYLPTTPNIDKFARSSHRFTNYYAACTFTTPSIASMLTGRYPSSVHVYHYGGPLHGSAAERTLPSQLRLSSYRTAASVANPGAHPGCLGFGGDFDILPAPPIKDFAAREATQLFHSAPLADEAARASLFVPYMLEQLSPRLFGEVHSTFPPALSFQQAQLILTELSDPFFLWVHVFAPHFPYQPEPPYLHRFLPTNELRTHAEFTDMIDLSGYSYRAAKQPVVDKARLRYDEWIAQSDAAFGDFMQRLEAGGRLRDTAVIVSADHGESFQQGFLGHGGPQQLRPIVHIPLAVRLPGQLHGSVITTVVDQTALAPTLLDIAGLATPSWMDGRSLAPLLRGERRDAPELAFTQFLVPNSVFGRIRRGTIGVIDGGHQCVLDIATRHSDLYGLSGSGGSNFYRPLENTALHASLRQQIFGRFPDAFGSGA
ncbi:MAG TPA: sulfatase [Steroidobacteraceae bacterium]|nr:sulfatase [Steroidobacteraceae bacterium]